MSNTRVAVVHDWLVCYAGAERVLEQILKIFPSADLYAVCDFLPPDERDFLSGRTPNTTFVQTLPWAKKHYRNYLPLMPLAIEQIDLSGYDLVISSSHSVAKGVITAPDQRHVCMCYSPMRYAWDLTFQYLRESRLDKGARSWVTRLFLHRLRLWDRQSAHGVDEFIAISEFVRRRIQKTYRRESCVIHPPVDVSQFTVSDTKDDYYLTVSRLVPYKRVSLLLEAFRHLPNRRLVVIGDGPDRERLQDTAPPNVELKGHQDSEVVRRHMARARAFVFAAIEDFGIVSVEAQAAGTPVIALGRGGVLDTVVPGCSGLLYSDQSVEDVVSAIQRFELHGVRWAPEEIRQHSLQFSPERFRDEFIAFVQRSMGEHASESRRMVLV